MENTNPLKFASAEPRGGYGSERQDIDEKNKTLDRGSDGSAATGS